MVGSLRLGAYTLALGAHTDKLERWPAAKYSTANLTEWFGESGIDVSYPNTDSVFIQLRFKAPERRELTVGAGKLTFGAEIDTPGATYAADWSISTWQTMQATPNEPSTVDELAQRFAYPLRALTSFVSDRPDSMTVEHLINTDSRREALLWRVAPRTEVRPWRAVSDYLFRVSDIDDFTNLIQAWWTLYEEVDPALGYFAQHINDGSTYSPERLVVLVAALEAYGDIHHKTADPKALRNQTGVASAVTGCTNPALDLLGFCRGYSPSLQALPETRLPRSRRRNPSVDPAGIRIDAVVSAARSRVRSRARHSTPRRALSRLARPVDTRRERNKYCVAVIMMATRQTRRAFAASQ